MKMSDLRNGGRTRDSRDSRDSEEAERRKKKCEVNRHQSRPSCLRRQTSDSSVSEYGAKNFRNDKFELI